MEEDEFFNSKVTKDLQEFKATADVIIANRMTDEIRDVEQKVYTTVELWVSQTVSGDLFVTAKMSAVNRFRDAMAPSVVNGLQQLNSPVDVVASRRFALKQKGFEYELDAMDLETFQRYGKFVWVVGRADTVLSRVIAGEGIIVSEVFSNRTGLKVGDTYEAPIGNHLFLRRDR